MKKKKPTPKRKIIHRTGKPERRRSHIASNRFGLVAKAQRSSTRKPLLLPPIGGDEALGPPWSPAETLGALIGGAIGGYALGGALEDLGATASPDAAAGGKRVGEALGMVIGALIGKFAGGRHDAAKAKAKMEEKAR